MTEFLASEGGGAVARLGSFAAQLNMLAGIALFLGALRLWFANRSRARLLLMVGMLLVAVGLSTRSAVEVGLVELDYYPGWKADMDQVLGEDHATFEYSEEDMETRSGVPRGWEGPYWWGQRGGLLLGCVLALISFGLEAKQGYKPTRKKARAR